MGAVTFSLDERLVACLKSVLPLEWLVETGTFRGDALARFVECFVELHSVELSAELHEQVCERFAGCDHVHVSQGDSPEFLRRLRSQTADRSVLYWLDAHWCVEDAAAGSGSQCPLLDELAAIGSVGDQSVVLIDDARLYLCPAPAPHDTSHWPSLPQVLAALGRLNDRHEVMIVNDVIVLFPPAARDALQQFARACGVDWLAVMEDRRECDDLQEQLRQVRDHVAAAKQTAAAYAAAISEQQERLDHYRQTSAADKATIEELGRTIHQLRQTIEQLRRTADEQKQAGQRHSDTVSTLRAQLQEVQQRCEAQREITRQRDAALARKHADLERVRSDLERRLTTLRERLHGRGSERVCGLK